MIKFLLIIPLVLGVQIAFAEDDLLNFLETKKEVLAQNRKKQMTIQLNRILGQTTAEQNIFLTFINKGDYERSLYQWWSAFSNSPFRHTDSGRALFGYLLFKNDLPVLGLETLFSVKNPKSIDPYLRKLWKETVQPNHPVWNYAKVKWKPDWGKTFGIATEVKVLSRQIYDAKNYTYILSLLKKTQPNTDERAWLQWQISLSLALQNKLDKSAKVLSNLKNSQQTLIGKDLLSLTIGRLLYQKGFLGAGINYYSKVPKSSEYWFTAQEEVAWAYIRKGEPQNTLAVTQTLVNNSFVPQVGPESIFLRSLAHLKVCDYPAVAVDLNDFKSRFVKKSKALLELTSSGRSASSEYLLRELREGRVKLLKLGVHAVKLPRYVSRDEILYNLAQTEKQLSIEAKTAGSLYARSLTGGTAKVGFQAAFDKFRKEVEIRLQTSKSEFYNRIKILTKEELSHIKQILQKMHIVEAEVIQQINLAQRVIAESSSKEIQQKGTTGSQKKYSLTFPFDGEIWFDDLSNYKVDIKKGCQAKK